MKKWIVFILFCLSIVSIRAAGKEVYDEKSYMLDYEVNSLLVQNGYLHLRGWAYIWDYQGFYEKQLPQGSHFFTLRIGKEIYDDQKDYSIDLTYLNASSSLSYCTSLQNNQKGMSGKCNYALKEIGFHFVVDLNQLSSIGNDQVSLILQVHTKNGKVFEAPLTYFGGLEKEVYQDVEVYFSHSLANASFEIDTSIDAFVKTGPSFDSARAKYQGQYLYLEKGVAFKNILDKRISESVTWYKVAYSPSHTIKGRLRIKEANSSMYAWIPSAYVKYTTNDFTLRFNHRPIIEADDLTLSLYALFDPLEDIKVYDKEDGNLLQQLIIEGSVDTSKEGEYRLIYHVKDALGFEKTHERRITVKNETPILEAKDRHLFINETITRELLMDQVEATDKEDGDLKDKVIIDSQLLDITKVGTYPVYYSVKDSGNKEAKDEALFTIIDPYASQPLKTYIRFISYDNLDTLEKTSIWLKDIETLKSYFNKEEPLLSFYS